MFLRFGAFYTTLGERLRKGFKCMSMYEIWESSVVHNTVCARTFWVSTCIQGVKLFFFCLVLFY